MSSLSYRDAGVDLDKYAEAMRRLPEHIQRTQTPRVMPLPGGFAGLFRLNQAPDTYKDPVLVSGTDGVGTKLKVAFQTGIYHTVGIDLVAMCVNDCLCVGAEPLFFLDYLALDRDDPERVARLVEGVAAGCVDAGAALIGGETAIMPDVYGPGEFDMAGFCVGVAERDELIDGKQAQPGDVLVGVASSGLHSNGYSLARKIVFEAAGLDVNDHVDELGQTAGEALLTPTRIYAKLVKHILADASLRPHVHGLAHITGGGLAENVQRLLPEGCEVHVDRTAWTPPPIFDWLQRLGNVDLEEMYRVFNMGIGFVFVVPSETATSLLDRLKEQGDTAIVVGEIRSTAS